MVAEVLFAGGRLDSVRAAGALDEQTSTNHRDTAYADCSLHCPADANWAIVDFFTDTAGVLSATTVVTGETLWVHFEFYNLSTVSYTTGGPWVIYDSSGFPWFRFGATATSTIGNFEYNSGTGASPVWTVVGSTWDWAGQTRYTVDIKLTLGSPHAFEFSVGGTLILSGTFTQASFTNAAYLVLKGMYSNLGSGTAYSQILCTRDISTIGAKVKYCRATGAGANTGFAGAYTDVNEQVNSDASAESSATAGQKTTHAMGDVTIPSGSEIKSVFHWLRAKNDGNAPTNLKSVLRSGGVDYSTGNLAGIGTSFGRIGARYNADPDTGSNWTQSGWNAVEAGFESAA
jgi:hypothetical protein